MGRITKPAGVEKKPPKALPPLEKPVLKSKKMKNKSYKNFNKFLYKLLKSFPQESIGISKKALLIMNNFVTDVLENLSNESGKLVAHSKKKTLGSLEVQTAVKLLIPGQLSKHTTIEALKAITTYHNNAERDVAKN